MAMPELRFRQIHLDFHTSESIEGVGADFDPDEFAATLEAARVNSVTCFARCHHGWMYYASEAFPERVHPQLARPNLLGEQIAACHARGIRVPVYITVQWDHYSAERHPEWLGVEADGRIAGTAPYQPGFYRHLCVNTPYRDFLKAHVREVLEMLPVDGIFFDIVQARECSCGRCKAAMIEAGLDPSSADHRLRYAREMIDEFKREMTAFVRRFNADCTIFYNAGHVGPSDRAAAAAYTHFELESLPSGGWGYLHFPLAMRYARNLGRDCMGMTGKFHTSWGDFHSFKNPAALQFECFQMLALNAKCSVGDQLHPRGRICPHTYALIGSVYREVEKKEPWCRGARPLVDIGVLTPEEFVGGSARGLPPSALGAVRMLQEGRHQFDVIDSASDFSKYRLVILPDAIPVNGELAAKLGRYVAGDGAVIASYKSGLDPAGGGFALDALGVRLVGEAPYSPDFIVPRGAIGAGLAETEHVMYLCGLEVEAAGAGEVLALVNVPYFNRTWRHFCSHRHTPSSGRAGYPAVVQSGRCIYFAHPIFRQYHENAPRWCRQLLMNAIGILLPEPLVRADAPSSTVVTLNEQSAEGRWVLHLLHYVPERRGKDFDIVEDVIPIHDVRLSVRADEQITRVACVPDGETLPFKENNGRVEFTLPKLEGHQMIALDFE